MRPCRLAATKATHPSTGTSTVAARRSVPAAAFYAAIAENGVLDVMLVECAPPCGDGDVTEAAVAANLSACRTSKFSMPQQPELGCPIATLF